jgi:hypothetical protein
LSCSGYQWFPDMVELGKLMKWLLLLNSCGLVTEFFCQNPLFGLGNRMEKHL